MASDFDRDNSIDALLRNARRDPAALEAGPACLDAESLAAWADGGLDADRVRAIEAHVADCARCQALSAVLFATDETVAAGVSATPAVPKVVPFRRNRVMYWMPIAAGTIAATLVIWLGVLDKNEVRSQAEAVITESRPAQTPIPDAVESRRDSQGQQVPSAEAARQSTAAAPPDAKRLQRKEAPAPAELRADRAKEEAAAANRARALAAEPAVSPPPARIAVPPPPAPVMMPPPAPPATPPPPPAAAATAASPVVTTSSTASASQGQVVGAVGGARQMSALEKVEPRVVAEFSSVALPSSIGGLPPGARAAGAVGGSGGRGGGGGGGRGAAVAMDAAKTLAPPFYWRILSTDVLERSADRLVWEAIAIDPPVRGLAGGAAPSATVCWIIGRAGLVLLTTDGKEFTRLTQPAPADLISITAQDALRATVTTAGGQTFTTGDGGKTWK